MFSIVYLHHQQHHNTIGLDNEHTTCSYHNKLDA